MNSYIELSRILVTIGSIGMITGIYAQGIKIWRFKSAKDVSAILVIASLLNEILWLNYGIAIREWPILIIDSVSIFGVILIVTGYLKYRKGTPKTTGDEQLLQE